MTGPNTIGAKPSVAIFRKLLRKPGCHTGVLQAGSEGDHPPGGVVPFEQAARKIARPKPAFL